MHRGRRRSRPQRTEADASIRLAALRGSAATVGSRTGWSAILPPAPRKRVHVILFLEIPPSTGAFVSLAARLPQGAVGRLGNDDPATVRILVSGRPLAEAWREVPPDTLVTFNLAEPMSAFLHHWTLAADDGAAAAHAMANTFNAAEAAVLGLAEAAAGALVRHLSPDGTVTAPEAVIAHLQRLPVLIGYVQSPNAYGATLDALLDVPQGTVDPLALGSRVRNVPKLIREPLEERLGPDLALYEALHTLRGEFRMYRSPAARAYQSPAGRAASG